jgi:hypothetical protein
MKLERPDKEQMAPSLSRINCRGHNYVSLSTIFFNDVNSCIIGVTENNERKTSTLKSSVVIYC